MALAAAPQRHCTTQPEAPNFRQNTEHRSIALHSAGFESHGFGASERAVAMANENGLASTVTVVFDPDIVETMRRVHPNHTIFVWWLR